MLRWLRAPLPMLDDLHARYGNAFTLHMPRLGGPMVFFAEPSAVRDIFALAPEVARAGEANVILRPILGNDSLLVLDGDRHLRERRLMLPPFHGDRMRAYGEAIREVTTRELERWPIGRPFPAHAAMQAITLDVIMRTIFGVGADDPRLAPLRDALVRWTTLGTSRLGTAMLLLTPPGRLGQLLEQVTGGRTRPCQVQAAHGSSLLCGECFGDQSAERLFEPFDEQSRGDAVSEHEQPEWIVAVIDLEFAQMADCGGRQLLRCAEAAAQPGSLGSGQGRRTDHSERNRLAPHAGIQE